MEKKKYLCIETKLEDGSVVVPLSKCPANPEMVMAALQFLTTGMSIKVSIQDEPIDFTSSFFSKVDL